MNEATIQARFEEFHAQNPHVYEELVGMCRRAKKAGRQRLGIGMLWEVLRWNEIFRTVHDQGEFKLNDHFRSRYARMIMSSEPDLIDVFELRELRAE